METLYEYLLDNYKENEPIFLADLQVDGMTRTNVRQQIKKLTDEMTVRIVSRWVGVMDCEITTHSLRNKMLLAVFFDHLR